MTTAVMLENMIGRPHLFSMCEVGGEGEMMEVKVTNPGWSEEPSRISSFLKKSPGYGSAGSDSIIAHGSLVLEYEDIVTIIGKEMQPSRLPAYFISNFN